MSKIVRPKTLALLGLGTITLLGLLYWRFGASRSSPPRTQNQPILKPERVIEFRKAYRIGNLDVFNSDGRSGKESVPTKGKVTVPAGKYVSLYVDNHIHDIEAFLAFSKTDEAKKIDKLTMYHTDPRKDSDPTISSWLHHWTSLSDLYLYIDKLRADDLEGMDKLTSLHSLGVNVTEIDDNALMEIGKVHALNRLHFMRTEIDDDGLRHLMRLQNLEDLSFDYAMIKGDGLAYLQGLPELRRLSLWNTPLTDAAVDHLLAFPQLENLALVHTEISDVGLMKLAQAPHLKRLDVRKTAVTRAGVLSFRRIAPHCSVSSDFPLPPTPTPKKPDPVS